MSLASDYSPSQDYYAQTSPDRRTDERPPRWSKMRSREGSEAGSVSEPRDEGRTRFDRSTNSMTSPQAGEDWASYRSRSSAGSSRGGRGGRPLSAPATSPSEVSARIRAQGIEDMEMQRIIGAVGKSCLDKHGSMAKAMKDIRTDGEGNIRKTDVRRFFEEHHVATRMADKFFDQFTRERRSSTVPLENIKDIFDTMVGDHYANKHKKNVHGLLRPMDCDEHIVVVNADMRKPEAYDSMDIDRLKQVTKNIRSREQRRYIDKYGAIQRDELQAMFKNYHLSNDQANEFFDSIDKKRTGTIAYKDLESGIAAYLGVKEDKKAKIHAGTQKGNVRKLDPDAMAKICDHLGTKAAQKYRTMHDAFRFTDHDENGYIDRWEVRSFFRNYGTKTKMADMFFDTLDTSRSGRIDFEEFKAYFAPYIQPGYHAPTTLRPGENQKSLHQSTGWANSRYDSIYDNVIGAKPNSHSNKKSRAQSAEPAGSRSSRRSDAGSVAMSLCEDELHRNRFGRFEGVSTYQASFNQDLFQVMSGNS